MDFFDKDIETFLGINTLPRNRKYKGPLNIMWHYFKDKISEDKIDAFKNKIDGLL